MFRFGPNLATFLSVYKILRPYHQYSWVRALNFHVISIFSVICSMFVNQSKASKFLYSGRTIGVNDFIRLPCRP